MTGSKATQNTADLLKQFQKDYGEEVGSFGGSLINSTRIPTGLFPFDLAVGGGLPRGKVTTIYGPESSNKTNAVYLAIANHQRMYPDLVCSFIDIETAFDPAWARKFGVDTEKLVVLKPTYAEETVDMVEALLYAEDAGFLAIDSLAALVTTQEGESSATKAVVGGAGLVIGKLCRKTGLALREQEKKGRYPNVVYINQTRYKIGVMFGDPETMPGGNMPRFQSSLWVRFYGKNITDNKISKVMPVGKSVDFVVKKWKVPILSASGHFDMVTVPNSGLNVGETNDINTVLQYLKDLGECEKAEKGQGWVIAGDTYPTQDEFKKRLYNDKNFGAEVRAAVIDAVLNQSSLLEEGEEGK